MAMTLWLEWFRCVRSLRASCSRSRTFAWLVLVLAALSTRLDLAGVTSFVRILRFSPSSYRRLLHVFHSSALSLERLTELWVQLTLRVFSPYTAGSYLVCLADGVKAPKEGRKMPAVRSLHQSADSNSKPPFIMGLPDDNYTSPWGKELDVGDGTACPTTTGRGHWSEVDRHLPRKEGPKHARGRVVNPFAKGSNRWPGSRNESRRFRKSSSGATSARRCSYASSSTPSTSRPFEATSARPTTAPRRLCRHSPSSSHHRATPPRTAVRLLSIVEAAGIEPEARLFR